MMDFAGQTEKIGHFLQPTAIATGQRVMAFPIDVMGEICMLRQKAKKKHSF
jgi:hypothetical protein